MKIALKSLYQVHIKQSNKKVIKFSLPLIEGRGWALGKRWSYQERKTDSENQQGVDERVCMSSLYICYISIYCLVVLVLLFFLVSVVCFCCWFEDMRMLSKYRSLKQIYATEASKFWYIYIFLCVWNSGFDGDPLCGKFILFCWVLLVFEFK